VGIGIVAVIGVGLWASAGPGGEFDGLDAQLAMAADEAGAGGRLTLSDATDFEWDEAHIFDAYSGSAQIEAELNGWSPLSPAGRLIVGDLFVASDGLQLVAFQRDGEVVAWTVVNQEQLAQTVVRFDPAGLPLATAPADEFIVRRLGDRRLGDSWLLEPAHPGEGT
jgi:hypothetical protein